MFTHVIKHRPDNALAGSQFIIHTRLRQQIACQLLTQKLIEAYVTIEGSNQLIAILERPFGWNVPLIAIRVGVANSIHPMPIEMLAEMW